MSDELEYCYFCEGYMCDCEQGEGEVEAEVKLNDYITVDYSRSKEKSVCYELIRIREEGGDIGIGVEDGKLASLFFKGTFYEMNENGDMIALSEDE